MASTVARKSHGARSATFLVFWDGEGDAPLTLTHADLISSASEGELAAKAIYSEFLNKTFANEQAVMTAAAELGLQTLFFGFDGTSGAIDPNANIGLDEAGYPTLQIGWEAGGYVVARIALAASISQ